MNQLHDSLLGRVHTLPTTLYDSDIEIDVKCKTCNEYESGKIERYRDFSLDFPSTSFQTEVKLETLIDSFFATEPLEYRCPVCEKTAVVDIGTNEENNDDEEDEKMKIENAKKQKFVDIEKKIKRLPSTLAIHVKRFRPDHVNKRFVKRSDGVILPPELDFAKFLSSDFLETKRSDLNQGDGLQAMWSRRDSEVEEREEQLREALGNSLPAKTLT